MTREAFAPAVCGLRVAILCVLTCLAPRAAAAQASFHGIGDLDGGPSISVAFDATRVGGTIYVVGSSGANNQVLCVEPNVPAGCVAQFNADTPVLWSWDGITATLTALPNLADPILAPVNAVSAYAITRDGAYIASQARSNSQFSGQTLAVRVARGTMSNLNLSAPPFPTLPPSSVASSISNDGSILYGLLGFPGRAYRFDVTTSSSTLIPLPEGSTHTGNAPTIRGTSANGAIMVGVSYSGAFTFSNGRAFRYVHAEPVGTVTQIPLLDGGTWNNAIAVSADGNLTLLSGNSARLPNGEVYIHDASTGDITPLGSPNTPWAPPGWAGITADGAVVALTFAGGGTVGRHAYFHNANGWFHLTSALAAQGVDVWADGWLIEGMGIAGISPDGTLVYGSGLHNGNREGFVAEFPAGYLASFSVPADPPSDTAIVGGWTVPDETLGGVVFMADGTYYLLDARHGSVPAGETASGFERGRYTWDAATGALTVATLQDTNGTIGFSGGNGILGIIATVSGDTLLVGPDPFAVRIPGPPGSIGGSWVHGDPRLENSSALLILLADGTYVFAIDGGTHDGIEAGTYVWSPGGAFTVTSSLDTSGDGGLTGGVGVTGDFTLQLSDDELHLLLTAEGNTFDFVRVVDPQAVVPSITSALSAGGVVGTPFAYTITATHGATFGAVGLPPGLSIDSETGLISGTPSVAGVYEVSIAAANSFGGSSGATLVLTIAPAKVRLVASAAIARDAAGQYVVTITVGNEGNSPATDAEITSVRLNKTVGAPVALPTIAPGASVNVIQTFPPSAGTSGSSNNVLQLRLRWTGGSIGTAERVTLP